MQPLIWDDPLTNPDLETETFQQQKLRPHQPHRALEGGNSSPARHEKDASKSANQPFGSIQSCENSTNWNHQPVLVGQSNFVVSLIIDISYYLKQLLSSLCAVHSSNIGARAHPTPSGCQVRSWGPDSTKASTVVRAGWCSCSHCESTMVFCDGSWSTSGGSLTMVVNDG